MRSVSASAIEVRLRGVYPDDCTTPLRQRRCDDARAATDIEHSITGLYPGKIEERTG
jgi:hypothetical protein